MRKFSFSEHLLALHQICACGNRSIEKHAETRLGFKLSLQHVTMAVAHECAVSPCESRCSQLQSEYTSLLCSFFTQHNYV